MLRRGYQPSSTRATPSVVECPGVTVVIMDGARTNTRARIEIDGREFLLDGGRDLVDLMTRIEAAARSEPTFVDISDRDGLISVLVSPGAHVVISVEHEGRTNIDSTPPIPVVGDWDL